MPKQLLNVKDVAELLGYQPPTIYRMVKASRIPFIRVGGQLRFDQAEVDAWLASKQRAAIL